MFLLNQKWKQKKQKINEKISKYKNSKTNYITNYRYVTHHIYCYGVCV